MCRGRTLVTGGVGAGSGGLLSSTTCFTASGLGGDLQCADGAAGRSVATDLGEVGAASGADVKGTGDAALGIGGLFVSTGPDAASAVFGSSAGSSSDSIGASETATGSLLAADSEDNSLGSSGSATGSAVVEGSGSGAVIGSSGSVASSSSVGLEGAATGSVATALDAGSSSFFSDWSGSTETAGS